MSFIEIRLNNLKKVINDIQINFINEWNYNVSKNLKIKNKYY
jgi:hypothetical protein